jgi:hypothetical protein
MKIVLCNFCNAQNRVVSYSANRIISCGNCHKQLPEPPAISAIRILHRYKYWLILGLIIGGATIMNSFKSSVTDIEPSKKNYQAAPPPSREREYLSAVTISQGVHQIFTNAEQIAPLRIVTPAGTESYYVKLSDAFTGALAMTFYIYGGQSFETEVPLGTYRIKYATGSTWYGKEHLFGADTSFSEADKTFEFSVQGNQISGYTVQLIRQRGGNLHTKSISANQF